MTIEEVEKNRVTWKKNDSKRDAGLTEPSIIASARNIAYENDENTAHLLDVYWRKDTSGNDPIIISIHGGGWFYGDKELYRFYCMRLAEFGFVVVNCNYRLAPEFQYPSAIEDVCKVVRWTMNYRKKYTINQSWFMVGDSAGAQLTSQYCIIAANAAYRKQLTFDTYDALPDGVALNCGLYDMKSIKNIHKNLYISGVKGKQLQLFQDVLSYMNGMFPPTYLMDSVNDDLQPHTLPMKEQLERCKIPFVYAEYGDDNPADGHVFHLNLYSKNGKHCNEEEMTFFKKLVK